MNHIVSWLFTDPISVTGDPNHPEVFHFWVPWIAFCVLGLLIPFYYWMEGRKRFFGGHTLHKYILDKMMNQLALVAFIGPFLMFGRWAADSSLFSWRVWRYLWALWIVALVVYWVVYFIRTYPGQIASYRRYRTMQQYMPIPKAKRARRPARAGSH